MKVLTLRRFLMMKIKHLILGFILSTLCALGLSVHAKQLSPRMISYSNGDIPETPNQIFEYVMPYADLAGPDKESMNRYQTYLLNAMAKVVSVKASDHKVRRRGIGEQAEDGSYNYYYEVWYKNKVCEMGIVNVRRNGNYSILVDACNRF